MNIEVTKETFYKIFNTFNRRLIKHVESAYIENYYCPDLDQKGFSQYSFISNVYQYYLTDINS